MEVTLIRDIDAWKELKVEWDRLISLNKDVNIFLEYEWLFSWWQHFRVKQELFILTVKEDSQTIGIFPLSKVSRLGFKCLEFIGSEVSDFEGALLFPQKEKEILNEVISFLLKRNDWDLWRIRRVPVETVFYSALAGLKPYINNSDYNIQEHKERTVFLDTTQNFEAYQKSLPTKLLADTRRCEKRLSEKGDVSFVEKIENKEAVKDTIDQIQAWHIQRRSEKDGRSLLEDNRMVEFLNEIAARFNEKGWLRVSSLKSGQVLCAAHLGFCYKEIYYYYLPAFDINYRPFTVSRLLLKRLIDGAFAMKAKRFDFMLGEEGYKMLWHPKTMPLGFAHLSARTIRGKVAFLLFDRFLPWLKKRRGQSW